MLAAIIALFSAFSAPADPLAAALLRKLTYPSSLRSGTPYQVSHCRRAPEGCERRVDLFAGYFRSAGEAYGIDPWLLAGMAVRESGLNPFAQGAGGEGGVLQIHPRTRTGRSMRWHTDPTYRKRCEREAGACQGPVVHAAASMLRKAIDRCGSIEAGLAGYNMGRCVPESRYARRALRARDELLRLAAEVDA